MYQKQVKQLVEWQKQHPDYENDDTLLNEYFKITLSLWVEAI